MNQDKVERAQGDLNLDMNTLNNLISGNYNSSQCSSMDSNFDTKTKSLSILSDTQQQPNPKDIIPFYNEIDQIIFQDTLKRQCFYSEMNEYENIEQIKNQRILLQKNSASKVTCVMDFNSKQLMVIKEIKTCSLENAIQKLDEYKIHYIMNQKYPQTSLKLFIPVQITKNESNYRIAACMERAQFNLYDYSREYQISQEYAQYILFQILQQILDMHSINIAHRDVKPQNIFFVKDKGWLLSDFGESQVYQEVESLYNIRGTIYFIPKSLKVQINQKSKAKQNLLYNDIYALVISIIMIQSQQYIPNIQEELEYSNEQILKDLLQIKQLDDLKNFINHKNFVIDEKYDLIQSPIYMKLNPNDIEQNQKLVFKSQICLYCYYLKNSDKIKVKFIKQLKQIIEQRIKRENFMTLDTDIIYLLYDCLFNGFYLKLKQPQQYIKNFDKYDVQKQKTLINLLFQYGFNEKTIYYARKLLDKSYFQDIHLLVIKCYQRNQMDAWKKERMQFNQYLQIDQLDSDCQYDYLSSLNNQENFLINTTRLSPTEFMNYQNISNCDNFDILIKTFKNFLQIYSTGNILQSQNALRYLISFMYKQPLYLYQKVLKEILLNYYFAHIDKNIRATLLQDLTQIYNFLNQSEFRRKQIKKISKEMFDPDSYQQIINHQIQIYQLKITLELIKKQKQFNSIIQRIIQKIQNIKKITIIKYKYCITQNLLSLVSGLSRIQQNNHQILSIIQFCFEYAYQNNYHQSYYDKFIQYSMSTQVILFELRNYKRFILFTNKYDLRSNYFSNQLISRIQDNLTLGSLKSNLQNKYYNFRKDLHQKFIFQWYLDRQ